MYQGQHPGNKSFVIIDSFLTNILYIVDKKLLDKKKILSILIHAVGF